ncbi:hypothetical protein LIER_24311 [Lithospermum erythrorhizon]|uniref:Uncharacterized protein n=1 Tax=Lithospermum erythrorhizon TaxID=34254 RepID=A0AAV3R3V2_LITER
MYHNSCVTEYINIESIHGYGHESLVKYLCHIIVLCNSIWYHRISPLPPFPAIFPSLLRSPPHLFFLTKLSPTNTTTRLFPIETSQPIISLPPLSTLLPTMTTPTYFTLANPSFTSHMSFQEQLMGLKLRNMMVAAYLKHAKVTFDALAAMGKAPPQDLFHIYIVRETHLLDSDYSRGLLPTPPFSGQFVARDNSSMSRGRGRSNRGRFTHGSSHASSTDRRVASSNWQSNGATDSHKARCFICDSLRHLANSCPHRSSTSQTHLVDGYSQQVRFVQPPSSPYTTQPYIPWVPDTGATHHITSNLASLQISEPYQRNDRLQVVNGQQMNIAHTAILYILMHDL